VRDDQRKDGKKRQTTLKRAKVTYKMTKSGRLTPHRAPRCETKRKGAGEVEEAALCAHKDEKDESNTNKTTK